jgi:tRNA threonylcarbamoyladenosine biosynthesis protein TsaE
VTPFRTQTRSPEETVSLAVRVGLLLRAGDVVVLSGELGAGKTVFAKGLARALGVVDEVVSPTFTLVRQYEGRIPFVHVDVYRLDRLQELHDVGFDELVGDTAVTVVEWGDRVGPLLPPDRLDVELAFTGRDDERAVTVEPMGRAWALRDDALAAVVEQGGETPGGEIPGEEAPNREAG